MKAHMQVLHVGKHYPPFMGGIETHLRALAEGLSSSVDVNVVVANSADEDVEERIGPVAVKRLRRRFTFRGAPISPGIGRAIRALKPDLVHVHLPNPIATVSLLASGYRGPLVATYHSDVVRQRILGAAFEPMLRHFLMRCDAIIATSENYARSSRTLRAFAKKCRIVPYGIDIGPFAHAESAQVEALRKKYGSRMILAVGRLIYYKGYEVLLEAMKNVDGHLVLVGEGVLRDSLVACVKSLGIENRVTFAGQVQNEDTAPYYHAARVFVLPSIARSEAFGIVQIEAMAAGCPVINTSLDSGVPFVSLDGVTGVTVPPHDSSALARAINGLLDEPARARALGVAGHRRAAEVFTASRMCDETLALYTELVPAGIGSSLEKTNIHGYSRAAAL